MTESHTPTGLVPFDECSDDFVPGRLIEPSRCPTCGAKVSTVEPTVRPCGPDPWEHRRGEPNGPLLMERVNILHPCGHKVEP